MSLPTLAWLDFAERDKRRVLDVIKLFRDRDTRDELGIGSVRDAYSDLMFPGTSTIQTRARYFLLIPWLYLYRERLERSYKTKTPVPQLMRSYEIACIGCLVRGGEHGDVIGIDARESLQRLPSSIYWSGLGRWGIRRFSSSIAEYHRLLTGLTRDADQVWRDDDGEPVAGFAQQRWDPSIPGPPDDWLDRLDFQLTHEEARYLRERILASCPGTVLAHIVDRCRPADESVVFPWMHPELAGFPPHLREHVEHARLGSLVLHGAAWLYNVMLAETRGSEVAAADYREQFGRWADELGDERAAVARWDLDRFWVLAREGLSTVGYRTERFVRGWHARVISVTSPHDLADDRVARDLIAARERELKRSRARLDNRRLLDIWQGPSGTGRLHYRWDRVVRDITNDILQGLEQAETNDA